MQRKLRSLGYGVHKVRGCYNEVGKPATRENSFLVFDKYQTFRLKEDVRALSEKYEQDCFLFKPKGEEQALLIGTNDAFGRREQILGRVRINMSDSENYSEIGSGIISFD